MGEPNIVAWFDDRWLDTFDRGVEEGFDSLSRRDQVLAMVGAAFDHEIGAGRRVLYAGPVGAHTAELADAFEAIGSKKAAKVIRKLAASFPGGVPAADDHERKRQVEELPDQSWKILNEFGRLFDECDPGGERVLLVQLYRWYHAQSEQRSAPGAGAKPMPTSMKKPPGKKKKADR
jgi:Domain of unknown function (DUF4375)